MFERCREQFDNGICQGDDFDFRAADVSYVRHSEAGLKPTFFLVGEAERHHSALWNDRCQIVIDGGTYLHR